MPKSVAVSGGFDPVHVGHMRMINAAARRGIVTVILNSDAWLMRKKGFIFMPFEHRKEILLSMANVHNVIAADDRDETVCEALKKLKPDYFANGGDRTDANTPEKGVCKQYGIKMLWNVGGKKIASSSGMANAVRQA